MKNKEKQNSIDNAHPSKEVHSNRTSKGRDRRDFLKKSALAVSTLGLSGSMPIFAGPFNFDGDPHLIPADKKLSPEWVRSLYKRGVPDLWKGEQLKYIGMPVGGIACGQLYIGGDGKLWLWHIFKINYSRRADSQLLVRMEQGGHYAYPEEAFKREDRPVAQGTAIKVKYKGKEIIKELSNKGFNDIGFRGEYPISKISYRDDASPVEVNLEAFSPFIPGELEKSANPCTIFTYRIKNTTNSTVKVELASWLENAVNPYDSDPKSGHRVSTLVSRDNRKTLYYTSESSGAAGVLKLEDQQGYGSLSWSLYRPSKKSRHVLDIAGTSDAASIFRALEDADGTIKKTSTLNDKKLSALSESLKIRPGEEKEVTLVLGWYFPHLNGQELDNNTRDMHLVTGIKDLKLHYANRFGSADAVAAHICDNYAALAGATRHWNKIWYGSTLPHWLLDRTFITLNCLASNTLIWFNNNRLWGWEGVDCCPGTCTHVWQYAQALAYVFPEAERNFREVTDLSELGLKANGAQNHRAENAHEVAHDGHCGTIVRLYREHKNAPDNEFLQRNYPNIKKMVQYIIAEDKDRDGLLEGKQQNTLDAAWYGPMAWISSLYLSALAAGKQMAIETGDTAFADQCNGILEKGRQNIVSELFNGEYFIHKPDPNHPKAISSNKGCHSDQLLGQSFAHIVGIPERIVPKKETVKALHSIWKYNYAPDAFDYQLRHKEIKGPRIYATEGEAGLLLTTWPKGGDDIAVPGMEEREDFPNFWSGPGIYFDEVWPGFEYQVASHMIWEGMLEKGLALTRTVHDRHNPLKRNPYNEVECSDHYSRSMSSYAVFLAVCGFDHHGPKGHLSFAPQLTPEDFRAPFTVAEGWGSFTQKREENTQINSIELAYGKLAINQLTFTLPQGARPSTAVLKVNGVEVQAEGTLDTEGRYRWNLAQKLNAGTILESEVRFS